MLFRRCSVVVLMYYRNRQYMPPVGRFTGVDPERHKRRPDENLYAYVRNNPILPVDPYGEGLFFRDLTAAESARVTSAGVEIRTRFRAHRVKIQAFLRTYRKEDPTASLDTLPWVLRRNFMLADHQRQCNLREALNTIDRKLEQISPTASL